MPFPNVPREKREQIALRKVKRFREEQAQRSSVVTGIEFDDPFFAIPTPPPWATLDLCWSCWKATEFWGKQLRLCKKNRQLSPEEETTCLEIRKQFFKYDREYANCMDRIYGLNRTSKSAQTTK